MTDKEQKYFFWKCSNTSCINHWRYPALPEENKGKIQKCVVCGGKLKKIMAACAPKPVKPAF